MTYEPKTTQGQREELMRLVGHMETWHGPTLREGLKGVLEDLEAAEAIVLRTRRRYESCEHAESYVKDLRRYCKGCGMQLSLAGRLGA